MKWPSRFSPIHGVSMTVILVIAAILAGCETLDSLEEREYTPVLRNPSGEQMTIEARFDRVWPELVDIMEQRGYADLETERETVRETYQTTVELEDQPRDKPLRETVDEGRGQITGITTEQKRVPFRLIEEHEWKTGALALINEMAGGDESKHLDLKWVEIEVRRRSDGELDWAEIDAVFDALESHFESEE